MNMSNRDGHIVSDTSISNNESIWRVLENTIAKLSNWHEWDRRLSLLYLLKKWKEKQLEKVSIILILRENLELWGLKKVNTLLNLLSISTIGPFIISMLMLGK